MLQIRYHTKFKSADTLLFAGARNDIERLRSFFLRWDGKDLDLIRHLEGQEKLYLFSVIALRLQRSAKKDSFAWNGDNGTWLISPLYQERIVDLLDGLLRTDYPGHQYLDCDDQAAQIMVSKDEYPLPSEKASQS